MVMVKMGERWVACLSIAYHIMLRIKWNKTWVNMISAKIIHKPLLSTNHWKKLSSSLKKRSAEWPRIPGIVVQPVLVSWLSVASSMLQMSEILEVSLSALPLEQLLGRMQPTSALAKLSLETTSLMTRTKQIEFYKTMVGLIRTETSTVILLDPYECGWRRRTYQALRWHVPSEMLWHIL